VQVNVRNYNQKYNGDRQMKDKVVKNKVTLEVLNPRGFLQSVPTSGLITPRPSSLNGRKIALMSEKLESLHFFDALEALLKKKYPTTTLLRFDSPANPARPDNTAEVAAKCDVWLEGVKTSGSSIVDYDIKMEKFGKPGATFCIDSLLNQRKRLAEVNGMPTLRIISIPSIEYLSAEGYPEKMKPVASSVFDAVIEALTTPLTAAEKHPKPFTYDYKPMKFTGDNYSEAVEKLQQYFVDNYLGDGLPVTPPTREAVAWMLTGTSRSPSEKIGVLSPRNGLATIEKIAINAVMAGAKPEYLPVIITAIECVAEPGFNLYHLSTSTGSPTPLIWVNGPIAKEIGMNSGIGFLGRGNRANNTIGRAIGLCLINIGWRLMDTDPGFTGDPEGFCNFTFAENEDESPWESFAVENDYKPEESTVTINETMAYNRNGPGGGMNSQTMEQSLDAIVRMLMGTGGIISRLMFVKGVRYQLSLNPTLARLLADAGFTKKSLTKWLYEKTCIKWEQLKKELKEAIKHLVSLGFIPDMKVQDIGAGTVIPAFKDLKQLAILVAGDAGGNTVLWTSPVGSTFINSDMADNIKSPVKPFMTKVIRGATLTKAGC
jgi:hypothetical protein